MSFAHYGDLAATIREFNSVLEQFYRAHGIVACIAGGAPRDALLFRPRKDIDVVILHSDRDKITVPEEAKGEDYHGCEVEAEWDLLGGVNVILLAKGIDSFRGAIARNDFGICQIGYTAAEGFFWTPAFEKDAQDKTFTLYREGDYERSVKRYERLKAKYVGWPMKVAASAGSIFS